MSTMDEFIVVAQDEAYEQKLDGYINFEHSDYGWAIYRTDELGKPKILVGWDGGEPEDQILVRDWAWVVEALNEAYAEGYRDGQGNG